jgi:pimeloyl-ACP methyl ester carboxylesterase
MVSTLLRALEVERADVMGYSRGGGVALQLAIRHPSLVNKLVSMSATFRKDGWYPSVFEAIGGLSAEAFADTPVEKARIWWFCRRCRTLVSRGSRRCWCRWVSAFLDDAPPKTPELF